MLLFTRFYGSLEGNRKLDHVLFIVSLVVAVIALVVLFGFARTSKQILISILVIAMGIGATFTAAYLPRQTGEKTISYELETLPEKNEILFFDTPEDKKLEDEQTEYLLVFAEHNNKSILKKISVKWDKINFTIIKDNNPRMDEHITYHSNGWLFPGSHMNKTYDIAVTKNDISLDALQYFTD